MLFRIFEVRNMAAGLRMAKDREALGQEMSDCKLVIATC
jgi:hypothetical protein